jgi:hypothetical protein
MNFSACSIPLTLPVPINNGGGHSKINVEKAMFFRKGQFNLGKTRKDQSLDKH